MVLPLPPPFVLRKAVFYVASLLLLPQHLSPRVGFKHENCAAKNYYLLVLVFVCYCFFFSFLKCHLPEARLNCCH